jgi:hypothetical protein
MTPLPTTDPISDKPKVEFGPGQIGNTTPKWANWMFRIYFYSASFVTLYLAFDTSITAHVSLVIIKWLTVSTMFVHGFSKMFGIDSRQYQQEANDAFANSRNLKN